jgi:hypothetical protein
MHTSHS